MFDQSYFPFCNETRHVVRHWRLRRYSFMSSHIVHCKEFECLSIWIRLILCKIFVLRFILRWSPTTQYLLAVPDNIHLHYLQASILNCLRICAFRGRSPLLEAYYVVLLFSIALVSCSKSLRLGEFAAFRGHISIHDHATCLKRRWCQS